MRVNKDQQVYGLLMRFGSTDSLVAAAESVCETGYRHTDAFTPFPLHGIHEALGARQSKLALAVLLGGIGGALGGLALQYWVSVSVYPHIVSGKPFFSWPSFVPIVFECTILGAALTSFLGMIGSNGLPRPHHPVFDGKAFDDASTDAFYLCIEAADPKFDLTATMAFAETLMPESVEVLYAEADDAGGHEG